MRVVHVVEQFSPLSETFVYDYVTELERQGATNDVVTFDRLNPSERPFPRVHELNLANRWAPTYLWRRGLAQLGIGKPHQAGWPLLRHQLGKIINQTGAEVLHAHFGPAAVFAAPVAEKLGTPLVVTFYGHDVSSLPEDPFWTRAYNQLWSRTKAVTVLSKEMKAAVEDLGCPSDLVSIVHLSRDLEQFPYRRPSPPVQTVLFVGRLVPKKAPLDAVRALERARTQGAELHLEMVGDGPLRDDVEQYVGEHGLNDHVTVHGQLPNRVVTNRMQEADIFFLPSKTSPNGDKEGTPTVLVEAQASGLPCVSTRHSGIPEMIPVENHDLLVEEGDVQALAEALTQVAARSTPVLERMAHRGREKVEQDFNLSSEAGHLLEIYRHVQSNVPHEQEVDTAR